MPLHLDCKLHDSATHENRTSVGSAVSLELVSLEVIFLRIVWRGPFCTSDLSSRRFLGTDVWAWIEQRDSSQMRFPL